jgi:thiamine kinase-like enzyme
MTPERKSKLFYNLIAWTMWAERSGVQAKSMREVKIQCAKMQRMFNDPLVTPGVREILGTPPSKKKLKKRGKSHQRLEQQMKHIRKQVEQVLKETDHRRSGKQRAKVTIKTRLQNLERHIKTLSEAVEKKYGERARQLLSE